MIFLGFILFFDPLKIGIAESLKSIQKLGVSIKIISGDNKYVARYIAHQIQMTDPAIMTGEEMHHMSSHSLTQKVKHVDIFAEIEPNQKEQIILALRKSGNVVGYMGDGINDTPALHAADASISVDTATDIVKEAADFVLLEKDLKVLACMRCACPVHGNSRAISGPKSPGATNAPKPPNLRLRGARLRPMKLFVPPTITPPDRPLGVLASVRAVRRNVLNIIPEIAYTQPIVTGAHRPGALAHGAGARGAAADLSRQRRQLPEIRGDDPDAAAGGRR